MRLYNKEIIRVKRDFYSFFYVVLHEATPSRFGCASFIGDQTRSALAQRQIFRVYHSNCEVDVNVFLPFLPTQPKIVCPAILQQQNFSSFSS